MDKIKQFQDSQQTLEYLEKYIKVLFEKEGIGKCTDRYLDNMRSVHPDTMITTLCLRLTQGGMDIRPLQLKDKSIMNADVRDEEITQLIIG